MTFQKALRHGEELLSFKGIADAKWDAWLLFEYVCGIDRNFYYIHRNDELLEEHYKRYEDALCKRMAHIPLQYITGEQEFMGLRFLVNPHVLIPRQDTEILVEEALKKIKPDMAVLDLCTGSGCIIISIAKQVPIRAFASDLSRQALLTAEENRKLHGVSVKWIESDLFEKIEGRFDVIVSNPPYIPSIEIQSLMPEVKDFEPLAALDGKEDGLWFYQRIIEEASGYLKSGGYLMFEIGYNQGEKVSGLMQANGYQEINILQDLAGLNRVVIGKRKEYV